MLRYEKQFPLGNGVSFYEFVNFLEEMYFVNYVVILEKTSSPNHYLIELITNIPIMSWGFENAVSGKVVLNKGEIIYSPDSKYFTIRASAKGMNLFNIWLFFIMAILGCFAILYTMYTQGQPTIDMFIGMGLMFLPLVPYMPVYLRDKDILNRIGALGKTLEKK